MRKLTLLIIAAVMLSGAAFAAWMLSITGNATYQITSSGDLQITKQLSGGSMDFTSGNGNITDTMEVYNTDGEIPMLFNLTETRTDNSTDNCIDFQDDCNVFYIVNGNNIQDNDIVTMMSGYNQIAVNVSCVQFACPQSIGIEINAEKQ